MDRGGSKKVPGLRCLPAHAGVADKSGGIRDRRTRRAEGCLGRRHNRIGRHLRRDYGFVLLYQDCDD